MSAQKSRPSKAASAFGARVAELRQAQGLTMTGLAEQIGVSEAYISLLESGGRRPSRKLIDKLAGLFASDSAPLLKDQLLVLAGHDPLSDAKSPQHSHYEKLLQQAPPDQFSTFIALVNSLIRQGQYGLAQARIEAGFKSFQQTAQLQMLVAYLELSRGKHDAGIVALEAAIRLKQAQPDSETIPLAELLLNLGVLHFFKGSACLGRRHEAESRGDAAAAGQARDEALASFARSREIYLDGLALEPGHLNLLDEYARVCFNLADLRPPTEAQADWQASIAAFEQVLAAPDKDQLEEEALLESSCFLAHAYTKAGRLEAARSALALITACQPRYGFGYYVLACHYALSAQESARGAAKNSAKNSAKSREREHCLQQGLLYLKKALGLKPGLRFQAWLEPDLEALRRLKPQQWQEALA